MQVEENKDKNIIFTDIRFSDDGRFNLWLRDYCEVSPDSKKMKSDTTNEEVWEVLFDAKERGIITAESVDDLNHFRVVT